MNATKTLPAAAAALLIGALSSPASAGAGDDHPQLQRDLDAIRRTGVSGLLAEKATPRGHTVVRSGVADLRTGGPVPWQARYRIGSTTKTFVSVVILQLVAERRLSLEDTVDRWLPGLVRGNGNDGRKITVRQLLRHNSGLYNYIFEMPLIKAALRDGYPGYLRERFREHRPAELVAMAMRHRPGWVPNGPGERRWSYSNTNYIVAGMILEKVTGRNWEREVRDRITRPLRMNSTAVPGPRHFPEPHAKAYQQFTNGKRLYDVTLSADNYADGGLVSTTTDLNRFFQALLGGRLLRPAQLAEMQKTVPAKEPGGSEPAHGRYGLGLEWNPLSCGGGYWTHGGDSFGVSNRGGVTPDGRRSVVLNISTEFFDQARETRKDAAAEKLVDRALCR